MKRITSLALAAVLILSVLALTACGGSKDLSDSKYVGSWKADSLSFAGESEGLDGGVFVLNLNGDGTGTFVSTDTDGVEETSNITWELTNDGFKTKGDTKLKFKDDGDNIKTSILGVELIFVRQ